MPRFRAFTPTIARPDAQRALQLGVVVRLDEHRQAQAHREIVEIGQQRIVGQRRDDQQQRVGADGAGLVDLHLVDGEVLADHGQLTGAACGLEVLHRAAEVVPVGEDGEARGPAGRVRLGGDRGIEVGCQLALRR